MSEPQGATTKQGNPMKVENDLEAATREWWAAHRAHEAAEKRLAAATAELLRLAEREEQ